MYNIAVIPGDGTGPEVVQEGLKVLKAVAKIYKFDYQVEMFDFGGERYLKNKELVGEKDIEKLKAYSAIYLGAIGHPQVKPGILEQGILLKIRFGLDQYINLRPVKLYNRDFCPLKNKVESDVDFVVVRENSEGLYKGMGEFKNKGTKDELALQLSYNTRKGVERCVRYAFEYTKKRNKKKNLTLCGKTNVLTYAWDLWQRVFDELAKEYSDVTTDYAHVDATTMWFVKNPEWFDVIVTDNMFGDIITDLGAMIQGGMGIAAGGNINPEGVSMFEPIGGSAPKYTGKNVINPLAAICALGMMLEIIGEDAAGQSVEQAVIKVVKNNLKSLGAGKMGHSTTEVGDMVVENLA
ncbi:MAG: 3-isopropylmalate dehydrogenase [Candidatus Omnitrophica bacterium]|nr:3-isopropylmalate dehydrogenase [Candidatus Omnitrophota bacterium]MBU1925804.1 3-isopropylmalate dehydrogenase [Candidatus Omnitrophota bacterium]